MRFAIALAALVVAGSLPAQQPRLEITLPPPAVLSRDGPLVRALNVISDSETQGLLESGFPARLHFRLELWSAGGLFDALRDQVEWDVFVYYDALGKKYRAARRGAGQRHHVDVIVRRSPTR